jgi:hypothetical protein
MRVCNPDRPPLGINGCDAAPTPPGFAEIGSDDLPVLHATGRSDRFRVLATRLNSNQSSSRWRSVAQARAPASLVCPRDSQRAHAPATG